MVHLVRRYRPAARTGKGDALSSAYLALDQWLSATADAARTIIGVIDADGRPAANCLDVCAGTGMFGDPVVGSVQVQVRMLNRYDRRPFPRRGRLVNALGHSLVRLQDLEFRVPISAIQVTRRLTGKCRPLRNGQFSRLSALDVVADEEGPWRGALLEDYELSLHLMVTGHRNECTQDTWVDQEALPDIRRLVRQRTRWGQGTMQCGAYLRQLWASRHVSKIGALEATYWRKLDDFGARAYDNGDVQEIDTPWRRRSPGGRRSAWSRQWPARAAASLGAYMDRCPLLPEAFALGLPLACAGTSDASGSYDPYPYPYP